MWLTARIRRGLERLDKANQGAPLSADEQRAKDEKIAKLNENINTLLQQMEKLGDEVCSHNMLPLPHERSRVFRVKLRNHRHF